MGVNNSKPINHIVQQSTIVRSPVNAGIVPAYRTIFSNNSGKVIAVPKDGAVILQTGQYSVTIPQNEFIKLFLNPTVELMISDPSYLIGYKMVYMVDQYRKRIPGVICIVTLKIPKHNNLILQSEGSHKRKEHYEMLNLSNKIDKSRHYDLDSQGDSVKHVGGDMVAWEHASKYCAYQIETLALTLCGQYGDILSCAELYDKNMAFAESAFTFEENRDPIIYEVGTSCVSKNDRPSVGTGKCLDYFHFFLRPIYALDYGYYQFQISKNREDIDQSTIAMSKMFNTMRKQTYGSNQRYIENRNGVHLVKHNGKWISSAIVQSEIDKQKLMQEQNKLIEQKLDEQNKELIREITPPRPVAQPVAQPIAQPVAQPIAQPVAQPIAQPIAQPVAHPVSQSFGQPVAQPIAQPTTEHVAQKIDANGSFNTYYSGPTADDLEYGNQTNKYIPMKPLNDQPTYSQSQPTYAQTQPTYSQSQPTYAQTQPTYSQSQPTYSQSQPTYSQSQPTYSQSQPTYGNTPNNQYQTYGNTPNNQYQTYGNTPNNQYQTYGNTPNNQYQTYGNTPYNNGMFGGLRNRFNGRQQ